jgi:hypothetical protein
MNKNIPFVDLKSKYSLGDKIPYSELLQTNEWNAKRQKIISRDKQQCKKCGKWETVDYTHYDSKTNSVFYSMFTDEYIYSLDSNGELIPSDLPLIERVDKPYVLHVHHHYYIHDKNPWEYPDDALITLCNWCHWEFHKNEKVPVYNSEDKLIKLFVSFCTRCNGTGSLEHYKHVENGICFKCNGTRYELTADK